MPPGIFVDSMILEPAGRLSCSVLVLGALKSFRSHSGVGTSDIVTESIGERVCKSRPETPTKINPIADIGSKTARIVRSLFIWILANI